VECGGPVRVWRGGRGEGGNRRVEGIVVLGEIGRLGDESTRPRGDYLCGGNLQGGNNETDKLGSATALS
jgi:hypothetical protein